MQKITFTTNVARNTLEHLKLLLQSLQQNLDSDEHEILVFVDTDNENTLEYLLSIKHKFKDLNIIKNTLPVPIGYARNKTIMTEYAKYDIVSYLQSDMVIGPHYDTDILKEVKRGRILSATRVEPPLHGESAVTITHDFGVDPTNFDFDGWNKFSNTVKRSELTNYFFAPITYYKQDWLDLNGYDTVFRRSREDSDLVQRCLHAGIELVQTFAANVYHFTCVSSRGKNWFDQRDQEIQRRVEMQQRADIIELNRFIRKWGNFNHGDKKLYKINIDLTPLNYNTQQLMNLEPFFTRVWLQSENEKNEIISVYENLHKVANNLYNISDDEWSKYKHLYRMENFDEIFKVGSPEHYNINITMDFNLIQTNNQFLSNIQNLYDLLGNTEIGEYELDNVLISIRNTDVAPVELKVNNPLYDKSFLAFY